MIELASFAAHNAVSRLDEAHADFSPLPWDDGAGSSNPLSLSTPAHATDEFPDEWEILNRDAFYQHPETKLLRYQPIAIYPGVIIDELLLRPIKPPASKRLWIVIEHTLGAVTWPDFETPGWNGQVLATKARLEWDALESDAESRHHAYFPDQYFNSMPPSNTYIFNVSVGVTDSDSKFSGFISGDSVRSVCGQLIPPF